MRHARVNPLSDIPIRWKLSLIILLTSAVVVFVAGAGLFTYELTSFRPAVRQRFGSIAEIAGIYSAPALANGDLKVARESLVPLQERPEILCAALYGTNGALLVQTGRGALPALSPAHVPPDSFSYGQLLMSRPIYFGDELVGAIFLRVNLSQQQASLNVYLSIVGLVIASLLALALLVGTRLQRIVSIPVLDLASVARKVTANKDYSLRARRRSGDEIGLLVDSFNQMLGQIQQRDATLRDNEERFRLAFEAGPLGMALISQDLRFLKVNPAFCRMLDYSEQDLLKRSLGDVTHQEDIGKDTAMFRRLFEGDLPAYAVEKRFLSSKNQLLWVNANAAIARAADGRPLYGLCLIENISQRKQIQESLHASEQRFRQLAESIHEVFWLTDADKKHMHYVSPAYAKIWGRSCASLYADPQTWIDAIHPDDRDRVRASAFTRQLSGDFDEEYRVIQPGGHVRWIRDRAFPVRGDDGGVTRIAGIAEDITERVTLEREVLEISSNEQRRIGRDLHDGLGQNLTSVAFKAKLLEDSLRKTDSPLASQALEVVKLVNDAIGQTRSLARGLDPIHVEEDGLAPALDQLAADTRKHFSVGCSFKGPESALPLDKFVCLQMYHIAREAVANAVKHARAKRIDVEMQTLPGEINLLVRDDGVGFSPSSTSLPGLGLRIMRYRAQSIGADLRVTSQKNAGAEVRCALREPRRNPAAGPTAPSPDGLSDV